MEWAYVWYILLKAGPRVENIKHIGWRNGAHIMWILWPAMAEERGFFSCLLGTTAFARISGDFLVFFYPPVSQLFWKLFRIKEAPDSSLFQLFQQPSKNQWFYTKGYLITSSSFWQLPLCIKMGSQIFENCGLKDITTGSLQTCI